MIPRLPLRKEAALSRGDLTDGEWRIFDPLLPDRGERGPPIKDKRRTVNGILWVLRTGAPWRDMPKTAIGTRRALYAVEQARGVGCRFRDPGEPWPARRRGTCHRFDGRAGASACSRRKRGNQE